MFCAAKPPFPVSAVGQISVKALIRLGVLEVVAKLTVRLWALQVIKKNWIRSNCVFRSIGVGKACSNLGGKIKQLISVLI